MNRWTEYIIYTQQDIINLEKKQNSDTCYDMDEPWRCYTKWNKPVTKGQILYDYKYNGYWGK